MSFRALFHLVFGLWLFLLVPRFRSAVLRRWRARSGGGHLVTLLEISLATACAAALVRALWPSPFYFPV